MAVGSERSRGAAVRRCGDVAGARGVGRSAAVMPGSRSAGRARVLHAGRLSTASTEVMQRKPRRKQRARRVRALFGVRGCGARPQRGLTAPLPAAALRFLSPSAAVSRSQGEEPRVAQRRAAAVRTGMALAVGLRPFPKV